MTKIYFHYNDKVNYGTYQIQVSSELIKHLSSQKDFSVSFEYESPNKTWYQLKAFYEAINQLLPQYNKERKEAGEIEFTENEFKAILKYVGGYYDTIPSKKGDITIFKSFKDISKDEMVNVLKRIENWAKVSKGYSLDITRETKEMIDFFK